MKLLKIALLGLTLTSSIIAQAGSESGGGGGKKEPLFKTVAGNIKAWIKSGNADSLEDILIQNGLSLSTYKTEMLKVLTNYNITFTDTPVLVNGYEKTCRGYVNKATGVNEIICNNSQFGSDTIEDIDEIYRQVHHEFAGLACMLNSGYIECIERNYNQVSDYRISNYISSFLKVQLVKRLPVAPVPKSAKRPNEVTLLSRYNGGTYAQAGFSFRFMTQDEKLTRNNWEILFEGREDFTNDYFDANTVVDDNSYVYDLGAKSCTDIASSVPEDRKSRPLVWLAYSEASPSELTPTRRADITVGHCYLIYSNDEVGRVVALFHVKSAKKNYSVTLDEIEVLNVTYDQE